MTTTSTTQKGVLVDLTRCIGCRGCQVACKSWNERGVKRTIAYGNFTNPPKLNSECYTRIQFLEEETAAGPVWNFIKIQCMHCKDPACASVCPVGAFTKTPSGAVKYNYDKCIGCRYCMIGCPFNVPKYEWEKSLFPWVRKCTFCSDRQAENLIPACIKVCPTNVMFYGDLDAVTAEAKKRLKENPGKYVDHIYGEKEAGGTSWMYLSAEPFEQIGFNTAIPPARLPEKTWAMLREIPVKVAGLATALSLIAYFRNRGGDEGGPSKTTRRKEK
jgi:formate dehydrogenase iron-sulfur subunit